VARVVLDGCSRRDELALADEPEAATLSDGPKLDMMREEEMSISASPEVDERAQ